MKNSTLNNMQGIDLPLNGIRIVDFSWIIAGPTATRHLAIMGAEVIKVETPNTGDPIRNIGPFTGPKGINKQRQTNEIASWLRHAIA